MITLAGISTAPHPADANARAVLSRAAATARLQVTGGGMLRTSSRLCLSVEHGDYNGTELFGVGTDRFVWIAFCANDRGVVRMFSANEAQDGVVAFAADNLPDPSTVRTLPGWQRYPLGAALALRLSGCPAGRGLDAVVFGDIPGGGMSRSASLSINLLLVMLAANGQRLDDRMRLARLAQAVENDHVGSPCGMLDQVMICHARAGAGTHYTPRSDAVRHLALGGEQGRLRFLCLDTGRARHGLEHATYPVRRGECERFAAMLAPEFGVACLADVRTQEQFAAVSQRFATSHPELLARLRYVHEAQLRLPTMLQAWRNGDLATLGALFREDGHGLRDTYDISGQELETMCDIVRTVPGVLGERMLGGGDCGTAAALVLAPAVAAVRAAVALAYPRSHPQFAAEHAVHECRTADGIAALPPL